MDCGFDLRAEKLIPIKGTKLQFALHHLNLKKTGTGTHIDSPAHGIAGGRSVHELNLDDLIAPCVVIDVSASCHENLIVGIQAISDFESKHGKIRPGCFVMVRTGWEKHWKTPSQYRNDLVFPTLSLETAGLLLKRNIAGLGIDTLSPDLPLSRFPVHELLRGSGKYIIENVANSQLLPPHGAFSLALPIKLEDAGEAPVRIIGLIPNASKDQNSME